MSSKRLAFVSCVVIAGALAACQPESTTTSAPASAPAEAPREAAAARTPEAVEALLETGYRFPELHRVRLDVDEAPSFSGPRRRPGLQIFRRTYDGVDVRADVRTSSVDGITWETRFHRELKEPERVRRAEVLSFERAAEKAGMARDAKARLVFDPELALIDGELVVKAFRLCVALTDADEETTVYVDAYSGDVVRRVSHEVSVSQSVPTAQFGRVDLDVTPGGIGTSRDPVRVSTLDVNAVPINGQGFASGIPSSTTSRIAYWNVSPTPDYRNDVLFGLRMAWDYYKAQHGRRGLQDMGQQIDFDPSFITGANDAVAYFMPAASGEGVNMFMNSGTGFIKIVQAQGWMSYVQLDVLGHEWTHAVYAKDTGDTSRDDYWGANGGLNESNSDLFGELIEARAMHLLGRQSDDEIHDGWLIANNLVRSMCDPLADGEKPGFMTWSADLDDPVKNIDAHLAAGPMNRVKCWLARGMVPKNASPPELQSPIGQDGFSPLGSAAVAKLQYASLPYLRAYPLPRTFANARQATLDASLIFGGKYNPTYKAVEDAFAAVNVGDPADRVPPTVTLTSGTTLTKSQPIVVDASAASGIRRVVFKLNSTVLGTIDAQPPPATPPQWQVLPTAPATVDLYDLLTITATDFHENTTTLSLPVIYDDTPPAITITEVTGCAPPTYCGPGLRDNRALKVETTDQSVINSITLTVDGVKVGTALGVASATLDVNFKTEGQHFVFANATDKVGKVGQSPGYRFDADYTPPAYTAGPVFTADPAVEGRVLVEACASDRSGLRGWAWLNIDVPFRSITTVTTSNTATTFCEKDRLDGVPVGTRTYRYRMVDNWGNEANTTGSFTVKPIAPTIQPPVVTVDPVNLGHISVSTKYYATNGVSSVWASVGNASDHLIVLPLTTFHPAASDAAGQVGHVFTADGLTPGHAYQVVVTVLAVNNLSTVVWSGAFVIPQQLTTVFNEVERNEYPHPNVVPSSTKQINGTFNGFRNASGGVVDQDDFNIVVPAGKTITVSTNFECNNTIIEVNRWDPAHGDFRDGDAVFSPTAPSSLSLPAWPSSVAGSSTFEIMVEYNWPNIAAGTTAGCSDPRYSLNVSVQ